MELILRPTKTISVTNSLYSVYIHLPISTKEKVHLTPGNDPVMVPEPLRGLKIMGAVKSCW